MNDLLSTSVSNYHMIFTNIHYLNYNCWIWHEYDWPRIKRSTQYESI